MISDTNHRFFFRVGNNFSGSYYFEGKGIVASNHCTKRTPRQLACSLEELEELTTRPRTPFDESNIQHMEYNNGVPTPFISASLSLIWAIWEAERQRKRGCGGIRLFVIDALAVDHECALDKITDFMSNKRHLDDSKYHAYKNFARCAEEVIVEHYIPERAIIARPLWKDLREHLPSWFFEQDYQNTFPGFREWSSRVGLHFGSLGGKMSPNRWAFLSRWKAASFTYALLSPPLDVDSFPFIVDGKSERRCVSINDALEIARSLLLESYFLLATYNSSMSLAHLMLEEWLKV